MASTVGWRVIGEVAVLVDARKADLRGQRQNEILALLLTRAGQTVSLSVICEELWGAEQPKTAKNSVQRFIADIRRAHGEHASLLQTVPLGYRLDASPADVDIGRAKALITAAADHRCRDEAELARASLVEALDLLTGIAFPGLRPLPFVLVAEVHIDELSTQAIEQLADIQIDLGLFDEARGRLTSHVAEHPFQESAAAKLMQVLYRLGRQRDALAAYEQIRCHLRDELGLLPGRKLQELHHQILTHELAGTSPLDAPDQNERDARVPLPPQLQLPHRVRLRKDTITTLQHELGQAVAEQDIRAILVGAEPGAGKTTMLAQIAGSLQADGWCVLYGRANPSEAAPYSEWSRVLEHLLEHCPDAYRAACIDPYHRSLHAITGEAADQEGGVSPPAPATRADVFADVASALGALGEVGPVLVVLDDLQWSSTSAVDLLDFVATHAVGEFVVLGSFRNNELGAAHPLRRLIGNSAFASRSRVKALPRLTLEDTAAILNDGGLAPPTQPDPLYVETVHRRSGGNAFFIAELARSLGGASNAAQPDACQVPNSIRRVVRSRLEGLSADRVEVLRAAAVIGVEFDPRVLSPALGWNRQDVFGAIEPLLRSELLIESPDAVRRFCFAHDLVRESVLAELPRTLASMLHEQVADALLSLPSERDSAGRICEHLVAASNPARTDQIVTFAEQAGRQAGAQLAYEEARSWFELALDHLAVLETSDSAEPRRRLSLSVGLGREMRQMGDREHRAVLLEAGDLAYQLGADDLLIEAAKSNHLGSHSESFGFDPARIDHIQRAIDAVAKDSADHALLLGLLTVETTFVASLAEREAMSAQSVEIARAVGDPNLLCRVLSLRHTAIQTPDTLGLRQRETAEAVELAATGTDPYARWWAHDTRVRVLGELGRFADIELQLQEMGRVGETLDQPLLNWMHRWHQAALLLALDRVEDAEVEAKAARAIGVAIDEPDTDATYGAIAAGVLLYRGNVAVLAELMKALIDQETDESSAARFRALLAFSLSDLGDADAWRVLEPDIANNFGSFHRDMTWSTSMVASAEALAKTAPPDLCEPMYEVLVVHAGTMAHSGPLFFGPIDRSLGLLAAAFDDPRADRHLADAAAAMEAAGSSYWLARVRLAMLSHNCPGDPARWRRQVVNAADRLKNPWLTAQAALIPQK